MVLLVFLMLFLLLALIFVLLVLFVPKGLFALLRRFYLPLALRLIFSCSLLLHAQLGHALSETERLFLLDLYFLGLDFNWRFVKDR